jgi:uncharacterized protein (TIGR01777 family)
MATILITGGTGMVGSSLTELLLLQGHRVVILTRASKSSAKAGLSYAVWNVEKDEIDAAAVAEADVIVHLAGAGVADKRWSASRKKEIVDSRVKSGNLLVKALSTLPNKVHTVVSASAIGWYGPDPQTKYAHPFVETAPPDDSFLGVTCAQWEEAIGPVTELDKRLVIIRIGIVLSRAGGAYAEFRKPMKFGLASVLGSGKQVVSWIHISDLVRVIAAAIEDSSYTGVYNAVAPDPVSNKVLVKAIAKGKGGFHITAPVPSLVLQIMLGEMSVEVLKSTTVSCKKVEEKGFVFNFPNIDSAVADLEK